MHVLDDGSTEALTILCMDWCLVSSLMAESMEHERRLLALSIDRVENGCKALVHGRYSISDMRNVSIVMEFLVVTGASSIHELPVKSSVRYLAARQVTASNMKDALSPICQTFCNLRRAVERNDFPLGPKDQLVIHSTLLMGFNLYFTIWLMLPLV